MPKSNLPGEKTVFVVEGQTSEDQDLLCSVEEYVKDYYKKQNGFTNGIHAEGSVVNTIATILFWDIMYDLDVPDAFRTPHQAVPLDFDSLCFYDNRKFQIEQRLKDICDWSQKTLLDWIGQRWETSCKITACPAQWDIFTSQTHFIGLIKCLKGKDSFFKSQGTSTVDFNSNSRAHFIRLGLASLGF